MNLSRMIGFSGFFFILALLAQGDPGYTADGTIRYKRPLRPTEFAATLSDILKISTRDLPFTRLPQLPLIYSNPKDVSPEWRALAVAASGRIFDTRPHRPPQGLWRINFGKGQGEVHPGVIDLQATHSATIDNPFRQTHYKISECITHAALLNNTQIPLELEPIHLHASGSWRLTIRLKAPLRVDEYRFARASLLIRINGQLNFEHVSEVPRDTWEYIDIDFEWIADKPLAVSLSIPEGGAPLAINYLELQGANFAFPGWPPPSHRLVLFPSPLEDGPYRREVLRQLCYRLFRRPLTAVELQDLEQRLVEGIKRTNDLKTALQVLIAELLIDPRCLYLEAHRQSGMAPCTAFEIAARWSFALLGRPPSEDWLALAAEGSLFMYLEQWLGAQDGARHASMLGQGLADFWLLGEEWNRLQVDATRYPTWPQLRQDFRRELYCFLNRHLQMRGMQPTRLIDANELSLNRNLSYHYGVYGPATAGFEPVPILSGHGRCGLPTMGALLILSAQGDDKKLDDRALWLWDCLLGHGDAPPPSEQLEALKTLLKPYDLLGRRIDRPDDEKGWDTTALRSFFTTQRKRFQDTLYERMQQYIIGYSLSQGDKAIEEVQDVIKQPQDRGSNPIEGDLLGVARRWLQHPRGRMKW